LYAAEPPAVLNVPAATSEPENGIMAKTDGLERPPPVTPPPMETQFSPLHLAM
jgi:hypothetical protein